MSKSFKIITLGCRVNQYESAYLKEGLVHAGWRQAVYSETAHAVIINTCIVTQRASHQSRQAIRKAIRENPQGMVAAVGCYAQVFPDELSEIKGLGLIADNRMKGRLPHLLSDSVDPKEEQVFLKDFEPAMPFEFLPIKRFPDRTRANLKIQDGCQSFCTYCIVPFARGPYRSLSSHKVLAMVESLAGEGYKEIILTGIHLGKYGVDLNGRMNLKRLLQAIGREGFPVRIRLSSLEPDEIDLDLIEMVASESWICRHLHISMQSGDDGVLSRMNRHYTAQDLAALTESIYHRIPLAAMGADFISGFPGEDDLAHENTCSLVRDLPLSYLHVFPFSPRRGTAAAAFGGKVAPGVIKTRAARLRDLGHTKMIHFYGGCLEKDFLVLPEKWHSAEKKMMQGRSDNYLPVLFPSSQDFLNQLVLVRMKRVEKKRVIGKML